VILNNIVIQDFLPKKKWIDVKNINYLHILAAVVLNVNTETEKLIVSMYLF
jgi:hypothetical protein